MDEDLEVSSNIQKSELERECVMPSTSKVSLPKVDVAVPSTSTESSKEVTPRSDVELFSNASASTSTKGIYQTPKRQKRRSLLLSEVNVSRVKDLTQKARHLYERAVEFRKRAVKFGKSRLSLRKALKFAEEVTTSEILQKAVSSMDTIRSRFFTSQIENINKKPKGRRYSLEDKVLALALYKQSASGYKLLSKLFSLPSRKTVTRLLNRIPIRPGLHEEVFSVLKAEAKNFTNPLDKYCILMFDEVSIQPNFYPNLKEDVINGFEDFGFKRTGEIANHAQVFMLRGIRRKWKQQIYYNFVSGGTKKYDLINILKEIINKCQNIGIKVIATVCDQGANNQAAINALVKETEEKYKRKGNDFHEFYYEINNEKIIPLFDVPHLFKGIRNNLLKYNLLFIEEGKRKYAQWADIYTACNYAAIMCVLTILNNLKTNYLII